ncbi:MAG: hypothetical protein NVSMB17_14040 [Candidatus Dormibacteria bacterium]
MAVDGNTMRWKRGRRGHYEGWFVTFNSPEDGAGYWLRYSLVAPTDPAREPCAQVWFMRTDASAAVRNRALRSTFDIGELAATASPFQVEIAGNGLQAGGCHGRLADSHGEVSWALRFESLLPGFTPTPEWGARLATCFQEPQPLLRVNGEIIEGGHKRAIEGWLGTQAHVFGVRHSDRWHWAESKHLEAGRSFTGVAAWPRFPPRTVTSLALLGAGVNFCRTGALEVFRPHTSHSPAGWSFDAEFARERLVGTVTPRPEDLLGITYHDPSGRPVYCYHSELADIELRYYRRQTRHSAWRLEEELRSGGSAAFEYGSVEPLPGVPLLLD